MNVFFLSLSILFFAPFVLAQETTNLVPGAGQLSSVYQLTNDSVNRLIYVLTFVAAVLGVFITGIVLFFAAKQIQVDAEIKRYKEDIRKQKVAIEEEMEKRVKETTEAGERIRKQEAEIEKRMIAIKKIGPPTKEAEQKLTEVQKELDRLRENIAYEKGRLSRNVIVTGIGDSTITSTGAYGINLGPTSTSWATTSTSGKFCSNCRHLNSFFATRCASCDKPLDNGTAGTASVR